MKFVNCEMHKVALAALVLGVFSLSPLANAVDAPSPASVLNNGAPVPAPSASDPGMADDDGGLVAANANDSEGMSLGRLRTLAPGFNIRLAGDMVYMDGTIPRKCANGASITMNSIPAADGKPGQHAIKFVPGEGCDKITAAESRDRVRLSSPALFGPGRTLPDNTVDGQVCISHADNGPEICDPILNAKFVSQNTILQDAADKQSVAQKKREAEEARLAADRRKQKEDAFIAKLNILCKQGDFVGFGAEIEAAKNFLGDVTQILSKVDGLKQKTLVAQITKAKDVDSIKDAYQNYLDAAEAAGWDTDDVTSQYADKRVEMMNEIVKDASKSGESRAREIRDLASDLREIDLYDKAHKSRIGAAYVDLANSLKESASNEDRSKYAEAEKYYQEAIQFADADTKVKIDAEIAKMYRAATDACLADAKEKGKGFNTCDALAKKEKSSMDAAIKAQSHVKGDGSLEALAGMKQEKIARFGQDGYSMNVSGYGSLNRMGGSYDSTKYMDYTQSQQQLMMQMMAKQQMGGTASGVAGGSTGFFQ